MTASGRIWTRTDRGWCTREALPADVARHAFIREWLRNEITFKQAADAIKARGITEFECAP